MSFHKNKMQKNKPGQDSEVVRVKLPKGKEVLGILDQRVGASRMLVRCLDGKTRNCRVPGRLRRKLWLREGDIVIVEPWEYGGKEKGDVIYKYTRNQSAFLKKQGHLDKLNELEEF